MKQVSLILPAAALVALLFVDYSFIRLLGVVIIMLFCSAYGVSWIMRRYIDGVTDRAVHYCYNGSSETISLTLVNRGIFPLDGVIVSLRGVGRKVVSVPMRSHYDMSFQIECRHRGVRHAGPVVLYGRDPFCFFPWEKSIEEYISIVVYPRFYPPHLILQRGKQGGHQNVRNPVYEDLSSLKAIRDYRYGDPIKRINWKASAKMGKLQTMEFSSTLSAPVFVLLDIEPENFPMLKNRHLMAERAIEAAASLITAYIEKREMAGLLTRDINGIKYAPLGRGKEHLISILEHLSRIELKADKKYSIIELFHHSGVTLSHGTHLYIITPRIDEALLSQSTLFAQQRLFVHIINASGHETSLAVPRRVDYYMLSSYGNTYY